MGEAERKFSQEQYDMLQRCSDAKDMTEWNEWRKKNLKADVLLEGANLGGFWLEGVRLGTGIYLKEGMILVEGKVNLQGADLGLANLQGAWLVQANLQGANLAEANLQGATLTKVNLQGAKLWRANLQEANLFGANLQGVWLEEANLQGAKLIIANLQGTILNRADLQGAKLSRANLQEANLFGANLQGAKLWKANLKESSFDEAQIQGADFTAAAVDGGTMIWDCDIDEDTDFTGVGLGNIRIDPESRQLLEYNVRRRRWERWYEWKDWFKDKHEIKRGIVSRCFHEVVRVFWWMSAYGSSTGRIIFTFFLLAFAFAGIYCCWPGLIMLTDKSGLRDFMHALYFSVVTMTTLGFGDIAANPDSRVGQLLLMVQVIFGYVLLGALITRFAVLFTAGGPTLSFKDIAKPKEESSEEAA